MITCRTKSLKLKLTSKSSISPCNCNRSSEPNSFIISRESSFKLALLCFCSLSLLLLLHRFGSEFFVVDDFLFVAV